jgi:hypothetical protein
MSRIFFAIATGCLMSGCAATGVDVNVDPFAKSSTDMSALAPDPGGAIHRTVLVNPKILHQISTAKSASPRNEVPSYHVEKSCKTRSSVGDGGGYDFCVQQEMAARDMLTKEWKSYSAEARNECAPASPDPANSYVALMTCFEMLEWIKDPSSIGGVTGGGATHAKSVSDSQPSQAAEPAEQAASSPDAPLPPQP